MTNPFVHCELATHDVAKAKSFYGKLFDWKLEDIPNEAAGGTYTMIGVGDDAGSPLAGFTMVGHDERDVDLQERGRDHGTRARRTRHSRDRPHLTQLGLLG